MCAHTFSELFDRSFLALNKTRTVKILLKIPKAFIKMFSRDTCAGYGFVSFRFSLCSSFVHAYYSYTHGINSLHARITFFAKYRTQAFFSSSSVNIPRIVKSNDPFSPFYEFFPFPPHPTGYVDNSIHLILVIAYEILYYNIIIVSSKTYRARFHADEIGKTGKKNVPDEVHGRV